MNLFKLYPQKNITIPSKGKDPLSNEGIQKVIKKQTDILGESGRIVVRKSGTEPIIRIMVESLDDKLSLNIANEISSSIEYLINKKD